MRAPLVSTCIAIVVFAASATTLAEPELPEEFRKEPWSSRTLSVGAPNDGALLRGKRLKATPALRLWNGSDIHAHATPQLLRVLGRAAERVRATHPGSAVVVHALSAEKGGAIRGKRSHRTGRDADIVLLARDAAGKPTIAKKLAHYGADGRSRGESLQFDDERNWALLDALVHDRDGTVTHLFIAPALRTRLLAHARATKVDEARVKKVASVLFADDGDEPLDALLHVRVACPKDQGAICVESSR